MSCFFRVSDTFRFCTGRAQFRLVEDHNKAVLKVIDLKISPVQEGEQDHIIVSPGAWAARGLAPAAGHPANER